MKRTIFFFLALCPVLAFATETLKIDFRYNTTADDGKNYLAWQTKGTKAKDMFDAVTGASKAHATKELRVLQTESGTKVLPKGLYALLLFAVSPSAQAKTDNLQIQADGKKLVISFFHRGNAYTITTDEKGRLNTRTSFTIAQNLADNENGVFTLKPKIEWEKVTFTADDYDENAESIWDGTLQTAFTDDVLTIKGKLKKIAPPEKPKPEISHDDTENTEDTVGEARSAENFTSEQESDSIEDTIAE